MEEGGVFARDVKIKRVHILTMASLIPSVSPTSTTDPNQGSCEPGEEKKGPSRRKTRCGVCPGCQQEDCGRCALCQDKVKYGGSGRKKQGCVNRRCAQLVSMINILPPISEGTAVITPPILI